MNETQWIFISIASFGFGYFTGYLSKNISRLIDNLGCIVAILITIFSIVVVVQIMNLSSVIVSLVFASGFLFKLLRN